MPENLVRYQHHQTGGDTNGSKSRPIALHTRDTLRGQSEFQRLLHLRHPRYQLGDGNGLPLAMS